MFLVDQNKRLLMLRLWFEDEWTELCEPANNDLT